MAVVSDGKEIQAALEAYTFFNGGFCFVGTGRYGIFQFTHGHGDVAGTQAHRCPRYIHGDITAADDQHLPALDDFRRVRETGIRTRFLLVLPDTNITQEIGIDQNAVEIIAGNGNTHSFMGTNCNQHCSKAVLKQIVQPGYCRV